MQIYTSILIISLDHLDTILYPTYSLPLCDEQMMSLLYALITINGVFLTILTTYLIGRATAHRQEQLIIEERCRPYFDKITAFRLVCKNILDFAFTHQKRTTDLVLFNKKYKPLLYFDYLETSCTDHMHPLAEGLMEENDFSDTETPFCLAVKTLVYPNGYNLMKYPELYGEQVMNVNYSFSFVAQLYEWNTFSRMKHLLRDKPEMLDWPYVKQDRTTQSFFTLLNQNNTEMSTEESFNKILDDFDTTYIPDLCGIMSKAIPNAIGTNKVIVAFLLLELLLGIITPIILLLFNVLYPCIVVIVGIITIILLCASVFEIIKDIKEKTTIYR